MIAEISVKFDDRDKNNKGWFAGFYDEHRAEIFHAHNGYPTRAGAFRQAIEQAKRDARNSDEKIADHDRIYVYSSITAGLPSHSESW